MARKGKYKNSTSYNPQNTEFNDQNNFWGLT